MPKLHEPTKDSDSQPMSATEQIKQSAARIQALEGKVHAWESLGNEIVAFNDAIVNERVSVMSSEQRLAEIQTQNQRTLLEINRRIAELLK